jgi:hypothetical protein
MKCLPLLAILVLGCGGTSTPQPVPPTAPQEKSVSEPASGTLEALLAQVADLPKSTMSFEMFVPQDLTWQGQPVTQNLAMTLVLDKLLGKQLYPDGFDQRPTGRRYKYKSDPPK